MYTYVGMDGNFFFLSCPLWNKLSNALPCRAFATLALALSLDDAFPR